MSRINNLNPFPFIAQWCTDPSDTDEIQLQKTLLVASTMMMGSLGVIWSMVYFLLAQPLAAVIPLIYSLLSATSLLVFAATRKYNFFRSSQLLVTLMLPFLLMLALGGFINSSAVILWSLTSPLGALVFAGRRQAIRWFLAYIGLIILGFLFSPFMSPGKLLPPSVVAVFFGLNIAGVSTVVFVLLQLFVSQKDAALESLRIEQAKSERLLQNVLPDEIAHLLKDDIRTIADYFDAVSIMFADVVGFTRLSAEMAPMEMVSLLNETFSFFDSVVAKFGLEKIRTIGDNYMVVSGAPKKRVDHAQVLVQAALEMNAFTIQNGRSLQFRIGINSGSAVAGVIGTSKFHYDLWGDSVNTASRMESHGLPGRVQITGDTYALIKDEFICQSRGVIDVKGKGNMETWLVEGMRPRTREAIDGTNLGST